MNSIQRKRLLRKMGDAGDFLKLVGVIGMAGSLMLMLIGILVK